MSRSPVELLPHEIAKHSISRDEIMLPYREALSALATLDRDGHRVVGLDAWMVDREGRLSPADVPDIGSLADLPREGALSAARQGMIQTQQRWERDRKAGELLFRVRVET